LDWNIVTAFPTLKFTVLCALFTPMFCADRFCGLAGQKNPGAILFPAHWAIAASEKKNPFDPLSIKLPVKVWLLNLVVKLSKLSSVNILAEPT